MIPNLLQKESLNYELKVRDTPKQKDSRMMKVMTCTVIGNKIKPLDLGEFQTQSIKRKKTSKQTCFTAKSHYSQ